MADDNSQAGPVATSGVEVDEPTLARVLRCDRTTIIRYARSGIITREKNKKFLLFRAVGDVVDYLRNAASRMGTGETMKASAALKDAQRRLTETKLAKLDGQLLSMPEAEAIWGDLVASAKWLFLALPARARLGMPDVMTHDAERRLGQICTEMLKEIALNGEMQLPTPDKLEKLDADDDAPGATEPKPAN